MTDESFNIIWKVDAVLPEQRGVEVEYVLEGPGNIRERRFLQVLDADPESLRRQIEQALPVMAFAIARARMQAPSDLAFAAGLTGRVDSCCTDCLRRQLGLLPPDPGIAAEQIGTAYPVEAS